MTWKEVINAYSWDQLMRAVIKIENTDISMLAYSWEDYNIEDEDTEVITTWYNFQTISISIEHGNVEVFIRCELDPEIQICYIEGDDKKESLKLAIIKTVEYLKERIKHEKLERANGFSGGVTI
jgi:hypothetical protein